MVQDVRQPRSALVIRDHQLFLRTIWNDLPSAHEMLSKLRISGIQLNSNVSVTDNTVPMLIHKLFIFCLSLVIQFESHDLELLER